MLQVARAPGRREEKKPPGDGTEIAEIGVSSSESFWVVEGTNKLNDGREICCISISPRGSAGGVSWSSSSSSTADSPRCWRVCMAWKSSCTGAQESSDMVESRLERVSGVAGQLSLSNSSDVILPSSDGAAECPGRRRL